MHTRSQNSRPFKAFHGFTLVELLISITILVVLAALIFSVIRKSIDSAKTSRSVSNLHQIYIGIGSWSAENNMRFPINYKANAFGGASKPKAEIAAIWYEAAGRNIYSDLYQKTSAAGLPWMWGSKFANGYEQTVFRSPNVENGYSRTIASYGYNSAFQRTDDPSMQTTVISVDPSRFNASKTGLIADNSGKTHSLSADGDAGNASINARNGASGPFKRDGKATVAFLDGHVELISYHRARQINNDRNNPFWGTSP